MSASAAVEGEIGVVPWVGLGCGVIAVMFMFGRDMPKPGPILSDQCLIFANLFMVTVEGSKERTRRERREEKRSWLLSCALVVLGYAVLSAIVIRLPEARMGTHTPLQAKYPWYL
jgi:hypothetical protein